MKLIYAALLISFSVFSQSKEYSVASIPTELQQNANAVIRSSVTKIRISSQRNMSIVTNRVITVFNEGGLAHLDASEYHSPKTKVRKIEAAVLDSNGSEIKRFKRKDFKDQSVSDGFSIFNDDRILYLNYTPITYPFTFIFQSEIETSNTAFIPSWTPIEDYFVSTEHALLEVSYIDQLGFRYKEVNLLDNSSITKTETNGLLRYEAKNLKAYKQEDYSPDFNKFAPVIYTAVDRFNLEGVDGNAGTWEEFGKWYYDSLLTGTDELPAETKAKVLTIVGSERDPVEIAKIIYKYVQDKTRYVSIQVGIGGFKPMLAKDVDKLGYGDCKALTNYTRALLNVVGVPAYYTVVYAGDRKRDLMEDFVSVQGNHVFLAIPHNDELIWLECTSQTSPFAFQGTFTDDRNVLLVTPDGGKLVHTPVSANQSNSQITKGRYAISADGTMNGLIEVSSTGSQYDSAYYRERLSVEDKDMYYKKRFGNLNNLKIGKVSFLNDRAAVTFLEHVELSASNFAVNNSGKLLFVVNAFNGTITSPKRYRSRENPFSISRGFYDYDEITIEVPAGYIIEAMPQQAEYKSKYGEYSAVYKQNADKTITYHRSMLLRQGTYDSQEYEDYRLFLEKVSRNDNAKIILTKTE